jgi:hypothetical protein
MFIIFGTTISNIFPIPVFFPEFKSVCSSWKNK